MHSLAERNSINQQETSPAATERSRAVAGSWCPVMLQLGPRAPRRSSVPYGVAIAMHILLLLLLCLRIREHRIRSTNAASTPAVTISLPAAPRSPVEDRVAPVVRPHALGVLQPQKIQKAMADERPAPPMADLHMASASALPALDPALAMGRPIAVTSNGGATDKDGKSNVAQLPAASEAAAPRSFASTEGALAGAKASWEGTVLAHLGRFRRYPAASKMRHEEGIVYVRFQVDRSGRILAALLERTSGFNALDKEALATLNRAQPLPAVPAQMPDQVELLLPIEFFLR